MAIGVVWYVGNRHRPTYSRDGLRVKLQYECVLERTFLALEIKTTGDDA